MENKFSDILFDPTIGKIVSAIIIIAVSIVFSDKLDRLTVAFGFPVPVLLLRYRR